MGGGEGKGMGRGKRMGGGDKIEYGRRELNMTHINCEASL